VARSASHRPLRTLGALACLVALLYGLIAAGVVWSTAQWTPKLALDLEGGTQIVLRPVSVAGQAEATPDQIDEALRIIERRVNGSGISEAEVTRQGDRNIVVSLPGAKDPETIALVRKSAQLQFRAVLVAQGTAPEPTPSPTGSPTGSPSPSPTGTGATPRPSGSATSSPKATAKPGGSPTATPSASVSTNGKAISDALLARPRVAATPSPTPTGTPAASATPSAATPSPGGPTPAPSGAPSPQPKPTDASDLNWIDEALGKQFTEIDCTDQKVRNALLGGVSDPKKPLVTCQDDGTAKYILGPAEVVGTDVSSASARLETNSQGFAGTNWQVDIVFTGDGGKKFGDVTRRLAALTGVQNQFGIVLDNVVISAPTTNEAIPGGQAQITGTFTQAEAQNLGNQLRYGALPVTFVPQTEDSIAATLGSDNLRGGLLAGLIGMLLVVVYSLLQYRALGLVTVASLVIAAVITYGLVVLFGWRQGYRLSFAGVAGLIVAIGITADSFIVFFERVKDEVRDGRGLGPAVEAAWLRARRTILASGAVNLLAATVLYLLAVGGVRGFAFTLGLTTVVDVLVVFLFTKPMVSLLARTRFFGGGHRLSGFDPEHLGRKVAYVGRGRFKTADVAVDTAGSSGSTGRRGATAVDVLEPGSTPAGQTPLRGRTATRSPAAATSDAPAGLGPVRGAPRARPSGDGLTIAERRAAAERAGRGAEGTGSEADQTPDEPSGGADENGRAQERSGATGRDV